MSNHLKTLSINISSLYSSIHALYVTASLLSSLSLFNLLRIHHFLLRFPDSPSLIYFICCSFLSFASSNYLDVGFLLAILFMFSAP